MFMFSITLKKYIGSLVLFVDGKVIISNLITFATRG